MYNLYIHTIVLCKNVVLKFGRMTLVIIKNLLSITKNCDNCSSKILTGVGPINSYKNIKRNPCNEIKSNWLVEKKKRRDINQQINFITIIATLRNNIIILLSWWVTRL